MGVLLVFIARIYVKLHYKTEFSQEISKGSPRFITKSDQELGKCLGAKCLSAGMRTGTGNPCKKMDVGARACHPSWWGWSGELASLGEPEG